MKVNVIQISYYKNISVTYSLILFFVNFTVKFIHKTRKYFFNHPVLYSNIKYYTKTSNLENSYSYKSNVLHSRSPSIETFGKILFAPIQPIARMYCNANQCLCIHTNSLNSIALRANSLRALRINVFVYSMQFVPY